MELAVSSYSWFRVALNTAVNADKKTRLWGAVKQNPSQALFTLLDTGVLHRLILACPDEEAGEV